jgi:hypothetical protein
MIDLFEFIYITDTSTGEIIWERLMETTYDFDRLSWIAYEI